MDEKQEQKFHQLTEEPVGRLISQLAVPCIISMLVTAFYNMADTFFVGQTGDPLQVAAVSLTNPIFILMMAFANMFGMGGIAVLSMAMGEKNGERVHHIEGHRGGTWLLMDFSAVVVHIFMDEARKFYDLERLWGDAEEIPLEKPQAAQ